MYALCVDLKRNHNKGLSCAWMGGALEHLDSSVRVGSDLIFNSHGSFNIPACLPVNVCDQIPFRLFHICRKLVVQCAVNK